MAGFIFSADPKSGFSSYDDLEQQRAVAKALAQSALSSAPKNLGEGLTAIGRALAYQFTARNLAEKEKAANGQYAAALNSILGGNTAAGSPNPAAPAATPPASPSIPTAALSGAQMSDTAVPLSGGTLTAQATQNSGLDSAIASAAAGTGVDPSYLTRVAMLESGGKSDAASPLSSAKGPFQFINSTAKQYGLTDPTNVGASANAAARLTSDNAQALTNALGREPSAGELYLAHQQGAGGAIKLLSNPNAPVESVIGADAARNNGAKPGMTAGQFAQMWTQKFGAPATSSDASALAFNGASQGSSPAQAAIAQALTAQPNSFAPLPASGAQPNVTDLAVRPTTLPIGGGATPAAQAAAAPSPTFDRRAREAATIRALSNVPTPQARTLAGALLQDYLKKDDKQTNDIINFEYARNHPGFDKFRQTTGNKFGLNPVYGTDASGKPVILQLGSGGGASVVQMPQGITPSTGIEKIDLGTQWALQDKRSGQIVGYLPKDLRGAEKEKAVGKAQGTVAASLPTDLMAANQTVQQIDELLNNKGLDSIVGPLDQYRRSFMLGDQGRDALARYDQLKGKAFLQAYTMLKGGGQITEVEGAKAENAMARMDRSQSEADFRQALHDFRDAVVTGVQKLKERAGLPGTAEPTTAPQPQPNAGLPAGWTVKVH